MKLCPGCNTLTSNPKYCSRSCAAKISNLIPKRKRTRICTHCTSLAESGSRKCLPCKKPSPIDKSIKLGFYRDKDSVKDKHPSWRNVHVRYYARSWNKDLAGAPCQKCNYSLHTELAHITPVSSYDDEAEMGEVNSPDNLLVLCPNCHWEFDHGILDISNIPKRPRQESNPHESSYSFNSLEARGDTGA